MWIVFGIKFKKIFSPDGMVEKARNGMNGLLRSMQKNTVDNINLVNETIQKLKQTQIEAERKIEFLNKKLELLQNEANMKQFTQSVTQAVRQNSASQPKTAQPKQPAVDPNAVYEVKTPAQNDLFESYRENLTKIIKQKDETVITETGAAYKEVPVISTKVLDENMVANVFAQDIPKVTPKKTVEEKVLYLFNNGYSVTDISKELSVSEVEVQFIIDLN